MNKKNLHAQICQQNIIFMKKNWTFNEIEQKTILPMKLQSLYWLESSHNNRKL